MRQKIKCWLGWHRWKDMCCDEYCDFAGWVLLEVTVITTALTDMEI